MKILKFIKVLLPSLQKRDVMEDMRITISDLENNIIPSYKVAADFFSTNPFKAKETKELSNRFYKNLTSNGIHKQRSMIGDIHLRLVNYLEILRDVQDTMESSLDEDILNEAMSIRKANLLKIESSGFFISRYSSELLNYIYTLEENNLSKDATSLPPKTVKYVNRLLTRYVYLLGDVGITLSEYKTIIAKIPDVIITEDNSSAIGSIYKESDIDPISSDGLNFIYNPIYHIRLTISQWQVNRYKEAKDKKKVLELRLLHIKTLKQGVEDAKLQKEIDYNQSRVDKLNRYISDVEEEVDKI